ncbi:hypothetical protein EST38_g12597 [Candolleomyces aberdarensis]|uniref:Uncharacterized protein n=1 Tax=Candolleomyces aberdarensis TaxID=2316362 RepID=A0A4Q2D203_9AGAR|nr:hypothetical protein EST38_g12597 [Candolleomyces aberdarensis]
MNSGRDADSGPGLAERRDGPSDEAIIALRMSLMESEQNAKLWKEQAEERRTEYIQSKSNARLLQIELDSTQKELARVQEECKGQGDLITELRKEIESKSLERLTEDTIPKGTRCKCSAEALETELKSTQEELTRVKNEYEAQRRLVDELRKDKKQAGMAKEPESPSKQPPSSMEERDDLWTGPVESQLEKARAETAPEIESNSAKKHIHVQDGELKAVRKGANSIWNGSIETQLEKSKAKCLLLKRKLEEMDGHVYQYHRAYQQERSHHHRMSYQAKALEVELNAAKKHIHTQDEELKAVRNELGAVKQQLSDAASLSEVRVKKLEAAQVFLTKADTLSVPEVVQKVNSLNEEIFQMSAFLGEVLFYEVLEPDTNRQEHRQAALQSTYESAKSLLGETLANALAQQSMNDPKEESNPLLVQIVMQIALTNWCGNIGRRWTSYHRVDAESIGEAKEGQSKESWGESSISKQLDHDRFICELYDSIRDHEDQAVAGRWRSLTKVHLPFSTNGWDHFLLIFICSIMSVAGWATRSDDEMAQVEERLGSIFKLLLDLRKATGEDVTSADLEISIISPGQVFNPSHMEDAYTDGRGSSKSKKSAPETVVITSGLGLQRLVVKRLKTGRVQRQAEILSMPKVVLEKTIKEALEPPPPSKKKKRTSGNPGAGSTGRGSILGI